MMKTRNIRFSLMALIWVVSIYPVAGQGLSPQESQEAATRPVKDSVRIMPFEVTEFTKAFGESNSLISESGKLHITDDIKEAYVSEVDTLFVLIDLFLGDSLNVPLDEMSVRELNLITQRSDFYLVELNRFQDRLSGETRQLRKQLANLSANKQRWVLTLKNRSESEVTEKRLIRIEGIIGSLDDMMELLQDDMGLLLMQQDRILDKENDVEQLKVQVREQKALRGEQLFSRDMPDLFSDASSLKDSTLMREHFNLLKRSVATDIEIMNSSFLTPMIVVSFLFLIALFFSIWYKRHFARMMSVAKFELSDVHMTLINSPVVTIVFITAILIRFIFPDLPHTFAAINLLIMMVPMTLIVIRLFGSHIRIWIIVLVIIATFTFIYEFFYHRDILIRFILLSLSIVGLWLFTWLAVKKPLASKFRKSVISDFFRGLIIFFAVLLFIAIIANLVGAFSLAEFFTLLPIQIAILAIAIYVATQVSDTLFFLMLAGNYIQKFNVVRDEFDVIYRKSVWLIDFSLWIFFFSTALRIFRVRDAVFEWGIGVFTNGIKIGAVDITLGNILIFVFVIWLSITVTRMVRYVLEKDVFTRVKMAKGVPSTIILLVRIIFITGGFFLAAKAAGMALTNLSIVLGAFSVGIGFGLQNIFNNMVSGLILAFERPIKVGDVVQVGELIGTVRKIGLRSSTVRSFDGAEVIVPNGNLISNEMINWTLSDSNRRMDIRIGVEYGTDPGIVISILEELAAEHEKVRKNPSPQAFFLGFGESSLDFRLLAWAHLDDRLDTESELNVALNQKLKEAGIRIPFPQHDLHLRSDHTKQAALQKSTDTKTPSPKPKPKK